MKTSKTSRRNIHASIIGNILEWYEFSLFAYLAPVISQLFFPSQSQTAALLSTLLVFAAGFVIRPLGSMVLGHLGDRWGRANTLKLTIFLMSISSMLTGLLPTHESVGILAPVLLIVCRLMQGFCIGGEFAGSMIYLAESAHAKERAFFSSMTNNGSNIGVLIAVLSCTVLSHTLNESDLVAYGWRLLFISGGILGLIGLWLRRSLSESDTFHQLQKNIAERYSPLKYVLSTQRKKMFYIFCLLVISACGSYTLMGYLSTYVHEFLNVPLTDAYEMQTIFIVISLALLPIFAKMSDRIGRKKILLYAITGYLIFAIPCIALLKIYPSWWVMLPMVICYSAEQAVTPVMIVEMFSGKGRYTGISLAYNLCMATAGGLSPAINTWLTHHFNNLWMMAYYIVFCALISLWVTLRHVPDEYGVDAELHLA